MDTIELRTPPSTPDTTAAHEDATTRPPSTPDAGSMEAFRRLLLNTLVSGVTSSFLWFALTFWVFLETRSVVATGVIGGAFSITSALLAPVMGTYVDRHRKHRAMMATTAASAACFTVATAVFLLVDAGDLLRLRSVWFWLFVGVTLVGSVAGQMRGIALSTCVTLLVPEDRRDRANGMIGTVTGASFAVTSVFSGLVIGTVGMGWATYAALALSLGALAHLTTIVFDEPDPQSAPPAAADADSDADSRPASDAPDLEPQPANPSRVDLRGAIEAIRAVPGLPLLIGLAAFNNLLAGVFMALVDAYGLSLVSVETWGLLWGFISMAFIAGGLIVARRGLGPDPLKVVVLGNLANWISCSLFGLRSSIVLLTIGMVVWLTLIPVIEAAEQTLLQRSIPYERQGRVFGFAQLVENASSPLTAFLMAPIAESVFMPFMTDGRGADWIGGWFGTGPDRGLALMFTLAGLVGVLGTVLARVSRSYRLLAAT